MIVKLKRIAGILVLFPVAALAGSTSLELVPPSYLAGSSAASVIPLANGNTIVITAPGYDVLIIGSDVFSTVDIRGLFFGQQAPLIFLDPSGNPIAQPALTLGSGSNSIAAAAVDAAGNIWIAGNTNSDDFPLVHPFVSTKAPYAFSGFIAKLDPTGSTILFSSFLDGSPAGSSVAGLTLDGSGNVYVAGFTGDLDFPTTVPVLGVAGAADAGYTFVTKIANDYQSILYSVLLGGGAAGYCMYPTTTCASTFVASINVSTAGEVTLAGTTNSTQFPITPNAFQSSSPCQDDYGRTFCPDYAFVTRIAADAKSLIWSTYIGQSTYVESMAVDSAGNVYLSGGADGNFSVTPGALQPVDTSTGTDNGPSLFLAKLSADGSTLLYGTYLGGMSGAELSGLALDAQGNLWVAGTTASPDFPSLPNTPLLGNDFALELNADGTALQKLYRLPTGVTTQPPVFDRSGNLLLLSSVGSLLKLDVTNAETKPAVVAVDNAAVLTAGDGVNPGSLVTLFGYNLGPAEGLTGTVNANGVYPDTLGGVQVMLAGRLAPLLYVGANQINLQVPVTFGHGALSVVTSAGSVTPIQTNVQFSLGIFQSAPGIAAALNQNMTVNSASNPAKRGEAVVFYLTGLALSEVEGMISRAAEPLDPALDGFEVMCSQALGPLQIFYIGPAPGIINGVEQLNVLIPDLAITPGQGPQLIYFTLTEIGRGFSNPVGVYVD